MGTITTTDGTEIFYKDWGNGQPIVFSHGWPLSADDAVHVGHSTGGGEVAHYLARHGESRVAVLVMHGDDDQVVPYADSGPLSAKLLRNGTLKTYSGFPHGMPTTQAETINADLLAFLRS